MLKKILLFFTFIVSAFSFSPKHIFFLPAKLNSDIPKELYSDFLSKLSQKSEVHISKNNLEENNKLINELLKNDKDLCVVSHLNSADYALNLCKSKKICDLVLINPIDTSYFNIPYFNPFKDFLDLDNLEILENGLNDFLRNNDNLKDYNINIKKKDEYLSEKKLERLLVIDKKPSKKWNLLPSFYLLDYLNLDTTELNFDIIKNKQTSTIEEYNHFDILDKAWAKGLNKVFNDKPNLEKYKNLEKYHSDIVELIFNEEETEDNEEETEDNNEETQDNSEIIDVTNS
jgi:hypothetical protein